MNEKGKETKWDYLKIVSQFTGHPYSLRITIDSPTRFSTEWIRRNRPTVKISEESIGTYFYATFVTADFKVMSSLEMELLNMLGNDGWEAFSVRRVPAERENEKPKDEFYFKRQLQMSSLEAPPTTGQLNLLDTASVVTDTSEPKPPPLFDVLLVGFPADKKIEVIRVIREVKPNLGLAGALELMGTLPAKLFAGLSEDQAR